MFLMDCLDLLILLQKVLQLDSSIHQLMGLNFDKFLIRRDYKCLELRKEKKERRGMCPREAKRTLTAFAERSIHSLTFVQIRY